MTTKTVFQLNDQGYFVGTTLADESPLEPGVWLIPGGCVEEVPPEYVEGFVPRFLNGTWVNESIPVEEPVDPTELSFEEKVFAVKAVVQTKLDSEAQAKGYDNILSACSYAAQPVGAPFQAEGVLFLNWRTDVWVTAYALLDEIVAGTRPFPAMDEVLTLMPELVLP